MILLPLFWPLMGFLVCYRNARIQVMPRTNNDTTVTQPSTNAVPSPWLACCSLIERPPRDKVQTKQRIHSIFLQRIISESWFSLPEPFTQLLSGFTALWPFFSGLQLPRCSPRLLLGRVRCRRCFSRGYSDVLFPSFLRCFFFDSQVATKLLVFAGRNLAPIPPVVKMFSYNSERGEVLCIKYDSRVFSFSSKLRSNICL